MGGKKKGKKKKKLSPEELKWLEEERLKAEEEERQRREEEERRIAEELRKKRELEEKLWAEEQARLESEEPEFMEWNLKIIQAEKDYKESVAEQEWVSHVTMIEREGHLIQPVARSLWWGWCSDLHIFVERERVSHTWWLYQRLWRRRRGEYLWLYRLLTKCTKQCLMLNLSTMMRWLISSITSF